MDLRFYAQVIRKGWRIIALSMLLATGGAILATAQATPVYESSTKLFVAGQPQSDINTALASGYLSQQRIASYADLVTSSPVLEQVALATGQPLTSAKITASPLSSTFILVITVRDESPQRAAAIANGFGTVVPKVIERIERPANRRPSPIVASVSQPAFPNFQAVSPRPRVNLALGLILGTLLGGLLALLKETLDRSIKSPDDLERTGAGLPLLGAVFFDAEGEKYPLTTTRSPQSPQAEAFRQLRSNVLFADVDSSLSSFVVTSAMPREGKSVLSANLAIALAQSGQQVILVEADLRRPALAEYMGFERAVGLTSVLVGTVALEDALQEFSGAEGLVVLPSGPIPPNPSELLGSQAMHDVVRQLEDLADVVIFDTPPLLPVTDAAILAAQTRGALVVIRANRTSREQVKRSVRALDAVGAHALGAALNFVKPKELAGYGYSYVDYSNDGVDARGPEAD